MRRWRWGHHGHDASLHYEGADARREGNKDEKDTGADENVIWNENPDDRKNVIFVFESPLKSYRHDVHDVEDEESRFLSATSQHQPLPNRHPRQRRQPYEWTTGR